MKSNDIKKLAKLTLEQNSTQKRVMDYVLSNLPRRQLVVYLRYLKMLIEENTVHIISKENISENLKKELTKRFAGKKVLFEEDKNIGDGIIAKINDTIIDLSLPSYVTEAIDELKQTLW